MKERMWRSVLALGVCVCVCVCVYLSCIYMKLSFYLKFCASCPTTNYVQFLVRVKSVNIFFR
jgi:hypothetical protein